MIAETSNNFLKMLIRLLPINARKKEFFAFYEAVIRHLPTKHKQDRFSLQISVIVIAYFDI